MKPTSFKKIITLRSKLITSFFFIVLSIAYLNAFANPPGSPYQAGATLDPTCAPMSANCYVEIIPDQTGNAGKYLTTDGSVMSWAAVSNSLSLQQVTTAGNTTTNDIYITNTSSSDNGFYIRPIGASIPVLSLVGSSLSGGFIQLSDGLDSFRTTLRVPTLSGNNSQTFQDTSGTIALLSNIPSGFSISSLLPATTGNLINNGDNEQEWQWNTLSSNGLTLSTNSTFGSSHSKLLNLVATGAAPGGQETALLYLESSKNSVIYQHGIESRVTGSSITNEAGYFSASGGTNNYAAIFDQGNVGIGQTTPGFKLHVGSSSVTDGTTLLRLQDTNSTCDFNANAGAPSCGSDLTLKKDISSLSTSDLLSKVSNLNPVSYHWLTEESSANLQYGFIAQEVATQFPELVTDHTWIDGTTRKFLNTGGLMPYVVGAIKEMNIKINGINDLTIPNTLRDNLVSWLSNATNRITRIFTGEICLTDADGTSECINKTELHNLKQLLNSQTPIGGGGGSGPTDVCPNIEGDQASIPDGYHMDNNNCIVNDIPQADQTPPTDDNPQAGSPSPTGDSPSN